METYVADLSDLDDLHRLIAAFRDHSHRSQPDDETLRQNLLRLLKEDGAEYLLAVDETRSGVGYIQLRFRYSLWLSGPEATLEDLFVSAESRKQGVATRLVQFSIQRATDMGCRCIKLDTNESNHAAIRLYEKLGFLSGSTRFPDSRQLLLKKTLPES